MFFCVHYADICEGDILIDTITIIILSVTYLALFFPMHSFSYVSAHQYSQTATSAYKPLLPLTLKVLQ